MPSKGGTCCHLYFGLISQHPEGALAAVKSLEVPAISKQLIDKTCSTITFAHITFTELIYLVCVRTKLSLLWTRIVHHLWNEL
jgi:hypothetical protein